MFSLVLKNVKVVDGLGNPWYHADVGVDGERIAHIGRIETKGSEKTIDGKNMMLAPGFIDMHSHSEMIFLSEKQSKLLEGRIRQGITTEIMGNCGISVSPVTNEMKPIMEASVGWMTPDKVPWEWNTMGEFLGLVEKGGVLVNLGTLTGHGAIRARVKGFSGGVSSSEEIRKMQGFLKETFEEGSFGFSCGLIYAPGMFADTNELTELGRIVADYDRLFTSHIRGSSETDIEAEKEVISIGEKAGCRVHRSHYEAFGKENWHKIEVTLKIDEEARQRGIDMTFDMFPYTAAMTMMIAIYPPWALDGGWPEFLKRVEDPKIRKKIENDVENVVPTWPTWRPGSWPHNLVKAGGWENIYIGYIPSEKNKAYEGLNLVELGKKVRKSPFDAITDVMVEEGGAISQLIFGVSGDRNTDEPLRAIIKHPLGGYATDAVDIGRGKPHPAAYGTYPRILGHYVRELKLLTLEDAIRRMTSFPANRLGLKGRGIIAEGFFADLVVFDPDRIIDRATYENPRQFSEGIHYVIVNGQVLLDDGKLTGNRPGKVLRK
ncbi:MAG: amidohydrolase family protein [Proteobacteria bacterium]|nr:amidohydrolase family protein [Pseudomonadota bacterium]